MAEYDLTTRLGQFLDRHLVFPLLEFISGKGIYDEKELLEGKLNLLKSTNMVDFAIDVYKSLNPDTEPPESFLEKRQHVVSELKEFQATSEQVIKLILSDEVQKEVQSNNRAGLFEILQKDHGVTQEMVDGLYKYAKFQYETGNYTGTAQYLSSHRILISPSDKNYLNNLWGKLASEILMQMWEKALEEFNRLKDFIDSNPFASPLQSLQQRTWLIHWSLFIFFNHEDGREMLIDLFFTKPQHGRQQQHHQPYLNAVQTMCPHILRYLTTAVITVRKRRELTKELVKVIQQESYTYRDPVTEFVECLCVNYDFDGAQKKLKECEKLFLNDFFLVALKDTFIENARQLVFETFCQIHEVISINMVSEKLNMTPEEAERWIVNLIRHARLDAKIDSQLGHVVMGAQAVSPYQQLIEKTKLMAFKNQMLTMNIEKKMSIQIAEKTWGTSDGY